MKVHTAMANNYGRATLNSNERSSVTARYPQGNRQKRSFEISPSSHYSSNSDTTRKSTSPSSNSILPFTPPPSPSPKSKLRYSQRHYTDNRSTIDVLADELIDMFEQTVQQCNAAENRYKRLDLTMKSTLNLQTKTYEHCIDELNKKIENLETTQKTPSTRSSVGSDFLNSILDDYELEKESSPEDGNSSLVSSSLQNTEMQKQIEHLKHQLMSTERSTQEMISYYVHELEKERMENKKLHDIISKQNSLIGALEAKLDRIIETGTLRSSTASSTDTAHTATTGKEGDARAKDSIQLLADHTKNEKLLEAQVELQSIELEDKNKLLCVLIDERDDLRKKMEELSKRIPRHADILERSTCTPVEFVKEQRESRSSIDLLAKIAQSDVSASAAGIDAAPNKRPKPIIKKSPTPLSFKKALDYDDHSPPPPSPPPKNPLPPTPYTQSVHSSTSIKRKTPYTPLSDTSKSSWSYLDYEEAKDSATNSYYIPPSIETEKPVYYPLDAKSHEWRKLLVKELNNSSHQKPAVERPHPSCSPHINGLSSLIKSWKKHVN